MKMIDGFPRRNRLDFNEQSELAIRDAIHEVEEIGTDPRLTVVVVLLGYALDKLADYIDLEKE